jgi:hypothetical protein
MNYIYERILLNQLAILEGLVVALPLGNRRGIQDSITQTEVVLRRMEQTPQQVAPTRPVFDPNPSFIAPRGGSGIDIVDPTTGVQPITT